MNLDKSNWKKVRFGDVVFEKKITVDAKNCGLNRYIAGEHMASEDLHLRNWGTIGDDYLGPAFHRKFEKGDILYGSRRTYLKKVAIADFDGVTANTTFVLRENTDLVVPGFIPFLMLSDVFTEHSVRNSKGSVNPYINYKDIAQFQFLLPPKDQQARLAELLWAGDAVVDKLSDIENSVQQLKTAVFRDFYRRHGSSNLVTVKSLLVDGPRNGYSPNTNSEGVGYKTVSIGAIQNGLFKPEDNLKYAVAEVTVIDHFGLRSGDILVVRGNGNRNLCGRAGLVSEDFSDLFYPDLLIRLRFDQNKLLPEFVAFQWNQPEIHSKLLRWAKSTNGIYKINGQDINRHTLIVPTLSIQKQIVKKLDSIRNCVKFAQIDHHQTILLQKSLLHQIFTP